MRLKKPLPDSPSTSGRARRPMTWLVSLGTVATIILVAVILRPWGGPDRSKPGRAAGSNSVADRSVARVAELPRDAAATGSLPSGVPSGVPATGGPPQSLEAVLRSNDPAVRAEAAVKLLSQGNELLARGQAEAAIAAYEQAAKLSPEDEDVFYNLGIALAAAGRIDDAIKAYEEALRILPEYAEAHNNMGNLLVRKGRLDEAVEHFKQALEFMPDHPSAHNNLGAALARQGKVDEAIAHFIKAIEFLPDYTDAIFNLGNAYASQGRYTEAIGEFNTVLKLKPDFQPALQALARTRQKTQSQIQIPLRPPDPPQAK